MLPNLLFSLLSTKLNLIKVEKLNLKRGKWNRLILSTYQKFEEFALAHISYVNFALQVVPVAQITSMLTQSLYLVLLCVLSVAPFLHFTLFGFLDLCFY